MKFSKNTSLWAMLIGGVLLSTTACKKDNPADPTPPPAPSSDVIVLHGTITQDTTLTNDKKWLLQGFVYIDNGATITIQAGTVIKGDKGSKGSLIIQRGAKIHAVGTSSQPVVFTSNQPVGSRDYGDWGGVILCGRANNNQPGGEAIIEGGPDAYYGGAGSPNDADNSGTMQYVRIEFAGIAFQPNQEINGLTFGAVGSGSTIDHIQVSYSGDDSYEWFGGAVNVKYMVAFRGWDDDFDTDNGFRGKAQFCLGMRDHNIADQSGSNGFESDNDATGSTSPPYTMPIFCNTTIFGPTAESSQTANSLFQHSAHIRRNSRCNILNSVMVGYPIGLYIDGSLSGDDATQGLLQVRNSIVSGSADPLDVSSGTSLDVASWFNTSGWNNSVVADMNTLGLNLPVNLTNPTLLPSAGSPLLSGADFSGNASDPFFQQVSYRGAFGADNWTAGWCNWDPQNTAY